MGYDTGDFEDTVLGTLHVEASIGLVIVQNANELKPPLRLKPAEARKLLQAIEVALFYCEGNAE